MTKIDARWVAGFHAIAPDGTPLIPGETVAKVGVDEARDSDNWEPVGKAPAKSKQEGDA
jgi:hypothetical protein